MKSNLCLSKKIYYPIFIILLLFGLTGCSEQGDYNVDVGKFSFNAPEYMQVDSESFDQNSISFGAECKKNQVLLSDKEDSIVVLVEQYEGVVFKQVKEFVLDNQTQESITGSKFIKTDQPIEFSQPEDVKVNGLDAFVVETHLGSSSDGLHGISYYVNINEDTVAVIGSQYKSATKEKVVDTLDAITSSIAVH